MNDSPLHVQLDRDGALLRLKLSRPKANIIDAAMITALDDVLDQNLGNERLLGVLLEAEGPHFSFGASVEEHLPAQCRAMLAKLHSLILRMAGFPVPILVAVQGQCLGGGLEVACAGNRIFATPNAMLGQPEIQLAVFAPAASCLLPPRIGQARAEQVLFSGASIDATEALRIGLVDQVDEDAVAAALTWFDQHLAGKSPSSLRYAVTAVREDYVRRLEEKLNALETLYLDELMQSHDAVEGLTAFLEKRKPEWNHH
jgi:cyclohexa-1,5-dienecarbonyl-CoA hydratase